MNFTDHHRAHQRLSIGRSQRVQRLGHEMLRAIARHIAPESNAILGTANRIAMAIAREPPFGTRGGKEIDVLPTRSAERKARQGHPVGRSWRIAKHGFVDHGETARTQQVLCRIGNARLLRNTSVIGEIPAPQINGRCRGIVNFDTIQLGRIGVGQGFVDQHGTNRVSHIHGPRRTTRLTAGPPTGGVIFVRRSIAQHQREAQAIGRGRPGCFILIAQGKERGARRRVDGEPILVIIQAILIHIIQCHPRITRGEAGPIRSQHIKCASRQGRSLGEGVKQPFAEMYARHVQGRQTGILKLDKIHPVDRGVVHDFRNLQLTRDRTDDPLSHISVDPKGQAKQKRQHQ